MKQTLNKIFIFLRKNLSFALAIIGIILGVALSISYSEKLPRIVSPGASLVVLSKTLDDMEAEQNTLKQQILDSDGQLSQTEKNINSNNLDLKGEVELADNLKSKAGLSDVSGEGIKITLADSGEKQFAQNAIAHASDLRDLVNYLWSKGATAISIKGAGVPEERIGYNSSIDCMVNTVIINGSKTVSPFEIKAIGNKTILQNAVNDKSALKQLYDRVVTEKLEFKVVAENKVDISKFSGNIILSYAQIK